MQHATEVLPGHKVPSAVIDVIDRAKSRVVLVTAYLRLYAGVELALRKARQRDVSIHCIVRTPDGGKVSKKQTEKEIQKLEELGVVVQRVPRLHAKVYLSESEAIVTSFNLVKASQDSLEFGVRITDPATVTECLETVKYYLEDANGLDASADESEAPESGTSAHCIGCGDPNHPFNLKKPLCLKCFRASAKATNYDKLSKRVCHKCSGPNASTVEKPVCYPCYKSLPPDVKASLTAAKD